MDTSNNWIKASLCDGGDEKTKELALALEDVEAIGKSNCLKIRDSIENIVHALLRVREMSSRLSEIFDSAIKEDELEMISNPNVVKDSEDVNPPEPPLSEGNSTFDTILVYSFKILVISLFQFLASPDEIIIDVHENSQEMQPLSLETA